MFSWSLYDDNIGFLNKKVTHQKFYCNKAIAKETWSEHNMLPVVGSHKLVQKYILGGNTP